MLQESSPDPLFRWTTNVDESELHPPTIVHPPVSVPESTAKEEFESKDKIKLRNPKQEPILVPETAAEEEMMSRKRKKESISVSETAAKEENVSRKSKKKKKRAKTRWHHEDSDEKLPEPIEILQPMEEARFELEAEESRPLHENISEKARIPLEADFHITEEMLLKEEIKPNKRDVDAEMFAKEDLPLEEKNQPKERIPLEPELPIKELPLKEKVKPKRRRPLEAELRITEEELVIEKIKPKKERHSEAELRTKEDLPLREKREKIKSKRRSPLEAELRKREELPRKEKIKFRKRTTDAATPQQVLNCSFRMQSLLSYFAILVHGSWYIGRWPQFYSMFVVYPFLCEK